MERRKPVKTAVLGLTGFLDCPEAIEIISIQGPRRSRFQYHFSMFLGEDQRAGLLAQGSLLLHPFSFGVAVGPTGFVAAVSRADAVSTVGAGNLAGGGVEEPLPWWTVVARLESMAVWIASSACLATFSVNSLRSELPG